MVITSSRLAAIRASGTQVIRSYQLSVYGEVISQAAVSSAAVRTVMVSGSRRGSVPGAPPGASLPRQHP